MRVPADLTRCWASREETLSIAGAIRGDFLEKISLQLGFANQTDLEELEMSHSSYISVLLDAQPPL